MPAASILIYSPVPGQHCADDNQRQEGLGSFHFGVERERTLLVSSRTDVHGFTPVVLFGIASAHVVLVVREQERYMLLLVVALGSGRSCWAGEATDGETRCRVQPCFPPHAACIRLAWRSIGDGFPVALK